MEILNKQFAAVFFMFLLTFAVQASISSEPIAELKSENMKFRGDGSRIEALGNVPPQYGDAFRIHVSGAVKNHWDVQLSSPSFGVIKEGDTGVLDLWARSVSDSGNLHVMMQRTARPYEKFGYYMLDLTPDWKHYRLIWRYKNTTDDKTSFAPGETGVCLNMGYGGQQVEVAGVKAFNYGENIDAEKLDATKFSYPGREADAAWRKAAAGRIEKLRKGDFSVTLSRDDGRPLVGIPVKIRLKRHAFPFGSAINLRMFLSSSDDGARYREEFPKLFNQSVFEVAMKWNQGWSYSDEIKSCLDYLEKHNISVRGHTLLWPSWKYSPAWLKTLAQDKNALAEAVRDHIYYEASMLKDRVVDFDVVNESRTNRDIIGILGESAMTGWYKTAYLAAPGVKLYMNDFDILAGAKKEWYAPGTPQSIYFETINRMLREGAPVGGIGMQGHFSDSAMASPEDMLDILDCFGQFNLPVKITEFDLTTFDEKLEADYLRDVMTVIFSHPQGAGFLMWGFWDGAHWRCAAPVFRRDWSLKPAGEMYKKLVFEVWTTTLEGATDGSGAFFGRGFYGDYELEALVNGQTIRRNFKLLPGIERIDIK